MTGWRPRRRRRRRGGADPARKPRGVPSYSSFPPAPGGLSAQGAAARRGGGGRSQPAGATRRWRWRWRWRRIPPENRAVCPPPTPPAAFLHGGPPHGGAAVADHSLPGRRGGGVPTAVIPPPRDTPAVPPPPGIHISGIIRNRILRALRIRHLFSDLGNPDICVMILDDLPACQDGRCGGLHSVLMFGNLCSISFASCLA